MRFLDAYSTKSGREITQPFSVNLILWTAVALMAVTACGGSSNADQPASVPIVAQVEGTPVVRKDIVHRLSISGSLLPDKEATVSAEVSGRATELLFDIQRAVRRGDILARLDDTEYRLQLAQSRAALAQARVAAERAGQDEARDTELFGAGSISRQALDLTRMSAEAARAQQDAAAAAVTLAEKRLQDTEIRAPISGIITARMINVGDYMRSPAPIATIMDLNALKMTLQAPERFASRIKSGQPIEISVEAYPDRIFEGAVSVINPAVNTATRTFTVEGKAPNPEGMLKPGFFAKITITTGTAPQALVIPAESVITAQDGPSVFLSKNGTAVLKPVTVGTQQDRIVEVLDGLAAGDTVLTRGHTTLTDGTPINIVR